MNNKKSKAIDKKKNPVKKVQAIPELANLYEKSKRLDKLTSTWLDVLLKEKIVAKDKKIFEQVYSELIEFKKSVTFNSFLYSETKYIPLRRVINIIETLLSKGMNFLYDYAFNFDVLLKYEAGKNRKAESICKVLLAKRFDRFQDRVLDLMLWFDQFFYEFERDYGK